MADQEKHLLFGENRSLFSDYYLRERLRDLPEWEQDLPNLEEQSQPYIDSAPADELLELTQKLINQMVNRLYGLSEEEFGVVEGSLQYDEAKIRIMEYISSLWVITNRNRRMTV